MRVAAVLLSSLLVGCHTEVKWAIRVPKESRECTRDCDDGAPDDPRWQACIAACGGEVTQEWCDGTTLKHRDPAGCREVETQKISVFWTVVFVAACVVGGSAALGVVAAKR